MESSSPAWPLNDSGGIQEKATGGDPGLGKFSTLWTVTLGVLMALLIVATVAGNALVMLAFVVDSSLRTQNNYFLLNLAISDFLVGKVPHLGFTSLHPPAISSASCRDPTELEQGWPGESWAGNPGRRNVLAGTSQEEGEASGGFSACLPFHGHNSNVAAKGCLKCFRACKESRFLVGQFFSLCR